jgi:hypothetical protein
MKNILKLKVKNNLAKYNLVGLKKNFSELESFFLTKKNSNVTIDFNRKKKRPDLEVLKKASENFNVFSFKYPIGYFAGCDNFSFRITFKEYKSGLKAAKFSLLLNQFNLDLDKFINLIQEVLINNFSLNFYETFFKEEINDIDFKIHFLVVLSARGTNSTTTKFFIIPKGCFFSHIKELIWPTLFSDPLFLYNILNYYKGFRKHLGLIFLLLVYYSYKLLHFN